MPRLRKISGLACIKILCKHFGFRIIRQKGSHVILLNPDKRATVVPLHGELKIGTLKGVLRLAKVNEDDFAESI